MRQDSPERALLQWRSEKGFACGFVILVHLLAAWAVTRPLPASDDDSPAMELVFIRLPPLPASTRPSPQARSHPSAAITVGRRLSPRRANTAQSPTTEAAVAIPQTIADDKWDLSAGNPRKDDGINFARNKLPTGFNPIRMGPPERFHMGDPSLASFVRAVAQTLFWPPGYTDDPCPGLKKAAQVFSDASTERERMLLEDAVLLESRYCRN